MRIKLLTVLAVATTGCGMGMIGDHADGTIAPEVGSGVQPFKAAPAALRRLTVSEYQRTLQSIFGNDITLPTDLESDAIANGLNAIGASNSTLSSKAVEKLEAAALSVATQAVESSRRARLGICTPANATDSACWTSLTTKLGRTIFRRPLEAEEVTRYAAIGPTATAALDDDVWQGVAFIISALLESPSFLFRVELPEPDPQDPSRGRYGSHAMATRLSYFLTHAPPDAALSALADAGDLTDPATIARETDRLLTTSESVEAVDDFFRDWLRLENLDTMVKNRDIYPLATEGMGPAMRDDIIRSIETIIDGGRGDYRDLFTSSVAFASSVLAPVYGVTVSGATQQVTVPSEQNRKGLLGKPGFLALYATTERSSPTLRGRFVREAILCEAIAAPPPDVATVVPEANPNAPTMRDRLAEHRTNATCSACHSLMDPIGLVMESFDGVGTFRTTDHGAALDLSGAIEDTTFVGLNGLADALVDDARLTDCATRTMYRYAVGHAETRSEEAAIRAIHDGFQAGRFTLASLMGAVAKSDGFRFATMEAP